jgi:hypothetical protein
MEKKIRAAYEEIEDRNKHKRRVVEELDNLLRSGGDGSTPAERSGRNALSPVTGSAKMVKAFFVGLPAKEVEVTRAAARQSGSKSEDPRVEDLRKAIELDSLMIEAKNNEINNDRRELEILRARASLQGGTHFRSSIVKVPYTFVGEAIDSARRIIPRKNREEILINRLNEETQKLETLKVQSATLDKIIREKYEGIPAAPASASETAEKEEQKPEEKKPAQSAVSAEEQSSLRKEIEALARRLEIQENAYLQEKAILERELQISTPAQPAAPSLSKSAAKAQHKLNKELREIEDDLKDLIHKESKLEAEESSILEKRIQKIDQVVKKVSSKALSQDLLSERSRIEERFSQIQSRRDFLSKELKRFEIAEAGAHS